MLIVPMSGAPPSFLWCDLSDVNTDCLVWFAWRLLVVLCPHPSLRRLSSLVLVHEERTRTDEQTHRPMRQSMVKKVADIVRSRIEKQNVRYSETKKIETEGGIREETVSQIVIFSFTMSDRSASIVLFLNVQKYKQRYDTKDRVYQCTNTTQPLKQLKQWCSLARKRKSRNTFVVLQQRPSKKKIYPPPSQEMLKKSYRTREESIAKVIRFGIFLPTSLCERWAELIALKRRRSAPVVCCLGVWYRQEKNRGR